MATQQEEIRDFMNAKCRYKFPTEVTFDEVRCFRHGRHDYAISIWRDEREVEAHPAGTYEYRTAGDPHATTYKMRYNTPFTEQESVVCIAQLGNDGKAQGGIWLMRAMSHSSYEYEIGRSEMERHEAGAETSLRFTEGCNHSLKIKDFVNLADMDDLGAMIKRAAKGQDNLQLFAKGCEQFMSDEEKKRWMRVERFGKLRKMVKDKREKLSKRLIINAMQKAKAIFPFRGR